jgi:hypothetical protein
LKHIVAKLKDFAEKTAAQLLSVSQTLRDGPNEGKRI